MAFIDLIEKIQKKPRRTRIQILWLAVFVSMFFVVSFWLNSFQNSVESNVEKEKSDKQLGQSIKGVKEELPSLMGSLKDAVDVFFQNEEGEEKEKEEESQKKTTGENYINFEKTEEVETEEPSGAQPEEEPSFFGPAKLPLSD